MSLPHETRSIQAPADTPTVFRNTPAVALTKEEQEDMSNIELHLANMRKNEDQWPCSLAISIITALRKQIPTPAVDTREREWGIRSKIDGTHKGPMSKKEAIEWAGAFASAYDLVWRYSASRWRDVSVSAVDADTPSDKEKT